MDLGADRALPSIDKEPKRQPEADWKSPGDPSEGDGASPRESSLSIYSKQATQSLPALSMGR